MKETSKLPRNIALKHKHHFRAARRHGTSPCLEGMGYHLLDGIQYLLIRHQLLAKASHVGKEKTCPTLQGGWGAQMGFNWQRHLHIVHIIDTQKKKLSKYIMKKHLDIRRRHTNHPSACLAHWGAVSPQRNNTWCQTRRRGKSTKSTGYRNGCSQLTCPANDVSPNQECHISFHFLNTFLVYPFCSSLLMCYKKMKKYTLHHSAPPTVTSHCPLNDPPFEVSDFTLGARTSLWPSRQEVTRPIFQSTTPASVRMDTLP